MATALIGDPDRDPLVTAAAVAVATFVAEHNRKPGALRISPRTLERAGLDLDALTIFAVPVLPDGSIDDAEVVAR